MFRNPRFVVKEHFVLFHRYNNVNTERKVTGYNISKFIKAITGIPKNIPVGTIKITL